MKHISYETLKATAEAHIKEIFAEKEKKEEPLPWINLEYDYTKGKYLLRCPHCGHEFYGALYTHECPSCSYKSKQTAYPPGEYNDNHLELIIRPEFIEDHMGLLVFLVLFDTKYSVTKEKIEIKETSEEVWDKIAFYDIERKVQYANSESKSSARMYNFWCSAREKDIVISDELADIFGITVPDSGHISVYTVWNALEHYYNTLKPAKETGKGGRKSKVYTGIIPVFPKYPYIEVLEKKRDSSTGTITETIKCGACGHEESIVPNYTDDYKCSKCGCKSRRPVNNMSYTYIVGNDEKVTVFGYKYYSEEYYPQFVVEIYKTGTIETYYGNSLGKYHPEKEPMIKRKTWQVRKMQYTSPETVIVGDLGFAKYSGIDVFVKENYLRNNDIIAYISLWIKNNLAESLVKRGLSELIIRDIAKNLGKPLDWDGSSVEEILGMSKALIKNLQNEAKKAETGYALAMIYNAYRGFYEIDKNVTPEMIGWFGDENVHPSQLKDIVTAFNVPLKRCREYLNLVKESQCYKPQFAVSEWRDYLLSSKQIGADLSDHKVKYPCSLKLEHDRATAKFNVIKNEKAAELFKHSTELYRFLEYSNKDFLIKTPKSISELFEEGRKLNHCVGSYSERIIRGETAILFIRKKDSPCEPYYTVEVCGDQVNQIRGNLNTTHLSKELFDFVNEWKKAKSLV